MRSSNTSWRVLRPAISVTLESLESRLLLSVTVPHIAEALDAAATYPPTQLDFLGTPGSAASAGHAISPVITVAVEDAAGDIVRSDDSVVMLHAVAGAFANHQSTIAAAAVDGIATFNNVILKKNGDHTLQATDGSLSAAAEGGFWVGPLTMDSRSALPLSTITLSGPALNSSQQYEIDFTAHGTTVQSPLTSILPIQVLAPIPLNSKKSAIATSAFRLSLEEPGGGVLPISGSLSVKAFPKDTAGLGSPTIDFLQSVQAALATAANDAKAVASDSGGAALAQSQFAQLDSAIAGEIQSIQSLVAGGPEPVVRTSDDGSRILLSDASLQLTDEMFAQLSRSLTPSAIAPDDSIAWEQSAGALLGTVRQANGAVAQGLGFIDSYGLSLGQQPPAAAGNAFAAGEFFALNVIPLAYTTLVDAGAAFINPPAGEAISVLRQYGFADQVNYFGQLSASFLYNSFGGVTLTGVTTGEDDAATAAADAFTDLDVKGGIGRELLEAADTGDATSVDYLSGPATSDGLLSAYNALPAPGTITPTPPPVTPSPPPHTPTPPPSNPITPSPPPVTPTPPPHTPSPPPVTPTPPPYTPSPPPVTPTPPPYTPSPPPVTPSPPPYTPSPPPVTPTPPPYTPSPPPYTPSPPPYTPSPPPYTPSPPPYTPSPPPTTDLARLTTKTPPPSATSPQNSADSASESPATQSTHPDTTATAGADPDERFVTTDAPSALDNTTYNTDSAATADDEKPTDNSTAASADSTAAIGVSKPSSIDANASDKTARPRHTSVRAFEPKWTHKDRAAADDPTGLVRPLVLPNGILDQSTKPAEKPRIRKPSSAPLNTTVDKPGSANPATAFLSARPVATLDAQTVKPAIDGRVPKMSHTSVDAESADGRRRRDDVHQPDSPRPHHEKDDMIKAEDPLALIAKPAPPLEGPTDAG